MNAKQRRYHLRHCLKTGTPVMVRAHTSANTVGTFEGVVADKVFWSKPDRARINFNNGMADTSIDVLVENLKERFETFDHQKKLINEY